MLRKLAEDGSTTSFCNAMFYSVLKILNAGESKKRSACHQTFIINSCYTFQLQIIILKQQSLTHVNGM
jgi:hypothetical protein